MPCLFMSAIELAEAIRRKKFSVTEIISAHLAQIHVTNPKINAMLACYNERALAQAKQADDALAKGQAKGALFGVPFTLKDFFETAGDVTTGGTLGLMRHISQHDATVAKRLKNAGAILLGKTNLPEWGLAADTDNLIIGKTVNPFDLNRSSGGSSGGEAAMIAAGGSAFGIGSDSGGSIRIPAHYCGIAGLRPCLGRIAKTGFISGALKGPVTLGTIGPLARKVADLRLIMSLITGADDMDPAALPLAWPNNPTNFRHLKIAYFSENKVAKPTADTIDAIKVAVQIAKDEGATVVEHCPPIENGLELCWQLIGAIGEQSYRRVLEKLGTQQIAPLTEKFLQIVAPYVCNLEQFFQRFAEWENYKNRLYEFMQPYDAIICPVTATPAIPKQHVLLDAENPQLLAGFSYCTSFSLVNFPVAVIRTNTSQEGLPIGVQIIAKPWREDMALNIAERLETQLGEWPRPTFREK